MAITPIPQQIFPSDIWANIYTHTEPLGAYTGLASTCHALRDVFNSALQSLIPIHFGCKPTSIAPLQEQYEGLMIARSKYATVLPRGKCAPGGQIINCLAVTPDVSKVMYAYRPHDAASCVKIYDAASKQIHLSNTLENEHIVFVDINANATRAVAQSKSSYIYILDLKEPNQEKKCIQILQGSHLQMSKDGNRLCFVAIDCALEIWNYDEDEKIFKCAHKKYIYESDGSLQNICCLKMNAEGTICASGSENGCLTLWDTDSATLIIKGQPITDSAICDIQMSKNCKWAVVRTDTPKLVYWDLTTNAFKILGDFLSNSNCGIECYTIDSDRIRVLVGIAPGDIVYWDPIKNCILHHVKSSNSGVFCLTLSSDGRILCSGGYEQQIWNLMPDQPQGRFQIHLLEHGNATRHILLSEDEGTVLLAPDFEKMEFLDLTPTAEKIKKFAIDEINRYEECFNFTIPNAFKNLPPSSKQEIIEHFQSIPEQDYIASFLSNGGFLTW